MFDHEALRGLLGVGALLGFGGVILALLQPAGSAEQVLSVCSAAMGLMLIGLIIGLARFGRRKGG
jgi:hypothetical protein